MNPVNLEIQLEACLRRLAKGATIEECLAAYPHNRTTLEPLLRAALELSAAVPAESLPTPEQIERMQARVLTSTAAQSKITRFPSRMVIRMGLMAAGVSLILGGYVVLASDKNDGESHGEALVSTATEAATNAATTAPTIIALAPTYTITDIPSATVTLRPSDTATTRPSDTPPPTVTDTATVPPPASETPVVVGDATELAVYVDITGPVIQDEQLTVAGVPIVEQNAGDFGFASGEVVTVSGLLLDEGQVLLEEARLATPDEQANAPQCPADTPKCDPVLLVLGEALGVEYTELAALNDTDTHLGNGEIARIYLLAQAGAGDVATLIAQRAAGASWRDLLPADTTQFANGVNLGNGKGQSIREQDSTPIYTGNSSNAPGQTHRPTARPSNNGNNGNGGQGNNGNNGNNGNGGNNGQGNQVNNGNNGQGNPDNQGNDE